jgi:transcriptional regulator with XRE-family HTH domain
MCKVTEPGDTRMRYGERLRQLREQTGLTQEQLAERSGVNLWTLRGYEQCRREPSWKGAIALAAALGVAVEAFADCEEVTPKPAHPARSQVPAESHGTAPADSTLAGRRGRKPNGQAAGPTSPGGKPGGRRRPAGGPGEADPERRREGRAGT